MEIKTVEIKKKLNNEWIIDSYVSVEIINVLNQIIAVVFTNANPR